MLLFMFIILTASLAPVIFLMLYIYRKDRYKKEPFGLLAKAFAGGILAALMDIVLLSLFGTGDLPYGASSFRQALHQAFCQAALPEEFCKLFFLYLFVWKSRDFNEYYDGIEYAAFVGLGFAGFENITYVIKYGLSVAVGRAFFAVPAHFFFAISMGFFFSFAKFRPWKKHYYLGLAYIVPVLLHGIYDFILMYKEIIQSTHILTAALLNLVFYVFFFFIWKQAQKKIRQLAGR